MWDLTTPFSLSSHPNTGINKSIAEFSHRARSRYTFLTHSFAMCEMLVASQTKQIPAPHLRGEYNWAQWLFHRYILARTYVCDAFLSAARVVSLWEHTLNNNEWVHSALAAPVAHGAHKARAFSSQINKRSLIRSARVSNQPVRAIISAQYSGERRLRRRVCEKLTICIRLPNWKHASAMPTATHHINMVTARLHNMLAVYFTFYLMKFTRCDTLGEPHNTLALHFTQLFNFVIKLKSLSIEKFSLENFDIVLRVA